MLHALLPIVVLLGLSGAGEAEPAVEHETHCVLFVTGQADDGEFLTSKPACFADEATADLWAATDPAGALPVNTATRSGSGGSAALTFTLGKHYDGFGGTGSSITIVGGSCTGGYWNTPSSWDNRISSSYNGCAHLKHWDLPSKSGSAENTYGSGTTDNLTFMNNRTESVSYHSS